MSNTKVHDRPIAVAGATGKQGGAVAKRLLARGHKVRALTRSPDKPAAQELAAKGAEVVRADLEDRISLDRALAGAGALFSVQDFLEAGVEAELRQGLNLTEAAAASGIEHIVYSGASTMDRNTAVPHLDSKWQVETRVRALDTPWTVFRPAAFMDNWEWDRRAILESGVVRYPIRPDTLYRQVAVADIAAMAVTAFEHPEIWTRHIMPLAGDVSTMDEITATLSRITGQTLRYEQMSWEQCVAEQGEELMLMYRYFDTFGMDGGPAYMRRFNPDAMDFETYLKSAGWGEDTKAKTV
ncbi:NmrA family NAD(P)-binding protein [Roseobacter sp. HKCCD9010]|uniref:NmrA/HSCARG family protein n=1 Tax=unclassified Roseobacter TaxID=196798 RepID=UPI001492CBF4|nr:MULTISPECIES: NmrA/HSCARG family protein [unclassified Roseobacter]MBF9050231.1 NmrA family NAD(P)-binding protein [Rhodobacterales bacterium HKCCD4356]NNV12474.1 NmrA family NAD(P)-binding protein [Roseobacter sp. HKCCD7357]NNV16061.1 NmrA family NAD(P)-binding protein [Roseobacter sp. HKCCD8768]NNV25521.1 NmrA family NAD(P)-binding protein [Roseobacter sp. HKCCD8192]NNV29778.1 NmrA family NAD(P)-binding protein [Roseobacter sp. HKCCD9061]